MVAMQLEAGIDEQSVDAAAHPFQWSETKCLAHELEVINRVQRQAGCEELGVGAAWADVHPGEAVHVGRTPGAERGQRFGGDGTPLVAEFCVAEFAALLGHNAWWGQRLIADALDLRHRLPTVWARVQAVEVEAWQARKVAQVTRPLTIDQARWVDQEIGETVGHLPWSRMEALLDAAVIKADPDRAARLAHEARTTLKAYVGRSDEHGIATVYGRVEAVDGVWLEAQIDRIAKLLVTVRQDQRCLDQRRATALGLLARPAEVIKLFDQAAQAAAEPAAPPVEPPVPAVEQSRTASDDQPPHDPLDDPEPPEPEPVPPELSNEQITAAMRRIDAADVAPPVTLYAHLAAEALAAGTGVVRIENLRPVITTLAQQWLIGTRVSVKPVIDLPAGRMPVDAYETPPVMREHVDLTHPFSVFPWAVTPSRRSDLHHIRRYLAGLRAQTSLGNLGPLGRGDHRVMTHGDWQGRQPEPGTYLFRAPHGHTYLVNSTGIHALGNSCFAEAVWGAVVPEGRVGRQVLP